MLETSVLLFSPSFGSGSSPILPLEKLYYNSNIIRNNFFVVEIPFLSILQTDDIM